MGKNATDSNRAYAILKFYGIGFVAFLNRGVCDATHCPLALGGVQTVARFDVLGHNHSSVLTSCCLHERIFPMDASVKSVVERRFQLTLSVAIHHDVNEGLC
jgi:hypothetical protein